MSQITVGKVGDRKFLQMGNELTEIVDYNIKSSADGSTELSVVIKRTSSEVEFSVNSLSRKVEPKDGTCQPKMVEPAEVARWVKEAIQQTFANFAEATCDTRKEGSDSIATSWQNRRKK